MFATAFRWIVLPVVLLLSMSSLAAGQEAGTGIEWIEGPQTVDLGDNLAQIKVPEGYIFAGADDTRELMRLNGNPPTDLEVGLIAPAAEDKNWFLVFEYDPVGYVKDDEKDKIDAKALLDSIREGTEQSNEQRQEMGAEPIHVLGWFEEPHYDAQTHNLVWAIEAESGTQEKSRLVNYDVRLLGRRGYTSATLVTDPSSLGADLKEVQALLQGFSYKTGNRYAEFVSGDKVADYGLVALVAGGAGAAAAKLGLLAKLGQFFAKAWKLVILGVAALIGALKKLFGGRSQNRETPITP